jgi:hypothetical protein
MALFSPGIETREIDVGASIQEVGSSPGAAVLDAEWGPVDERVLITNETELINTFGEPNDTNATRWFTAANFLNYSGALYVVRVVASDALNATDEGTGVLIRNEDALAGVTVSGFSFIAKYPGDIGNSLKVEVCDNSANFDAWGFSGQFDSAPGTSDYATSFGASEDELHIVVVDEDGLVSGVPNTVLETFGFLSKASDGRDTFGASTFYRDVINQQSQYVYAGTLELSTAGVGELSYGDSVTGAAAFATGGAIISDSLTGGTLGTGAGAAELTTGVALYTSPEDVDISVILTADGGEALGASTHNLADAATTIAEARGDCIVVVSPMVLSSTGVVASDPVDEIQTFASTLTRSSYVFVDSGWKFQFDKYNDKNRYVPLNGDIGGIISRLDRVSEPWFSPGGFTRGNVLNVVKLAFNPQQAQRDTLYKLGINPVVTFPGAGTVLFGDKTFVSKPGVFDRINVRRLFIVLRKSVSEFARSYLFENNDAFTRAQFRSATEQFLENIRSRRGVEDFRVVVDETNNTPQVINSNSFVGDIFVRPFRSINFIRLNFVGVRFGIEFSEIVG